MVLPCVPATATFDFSRISSASISARRTTGRFFARAASSSGLPGLIAEEITTTCAPSRFSAFWPMKTRAPFASSRSVIGDRLEVRALHGEAVVQQHLGDPRHADAADADEVDRPDVVGQPRLSVHASASFSGEVLDQRRQMFGRVRAPLAAARLRPSPRAPSGSDRIAVMCPASPSAVNSASRIMKAPPAATSPAAFAAWWSSVACGIGDQDRRPADDGDVGDRARPGAADHQRRLGQPLRHVVEEAAQLRREPDLLVGRPHPVHVLRPHLLAEPQPARSSGASSRSASGTPRRTGPAALAAADHQQPHRPVAGLEIGARRAGRAPPRAPGCRCAPPSRRSAARVGQMPQATTSTWGAK